MKKHNYLLLKRVESIENHSEAVYSAVNSSIDIENKQHFISK